MTGMQYRTQQKQGSCHSYPGKVHRTEYLVVFYQAVKHIEEDKSAATQLQENAVGKNIGSKVPPGYSVDLVHV